MIRKIPGLSMRDARKNYLQTFPLMSTSKPSSKFLTNWDCDMSRYRAVHCLIWNDDKFPFFSDDGKLVVFHLLTTPFSTPFGLFKASLGALSDEMRWKRERYSKAFAEVSTKGFVDHDEMALLFLLPNFLKYNPPNNPNVLKSWGKQFSELPNSILKRKCFEILKGLSEGLGKAFSEAFEKSFGNDMPIQDQVTISGTVTDNSCVPKKTSDKKPLDLRLEEFEFFWGEYPACGDPPKKKRKEDARLRWSALIKKNDLPSLDAIMVALNDDKESRQWDSPKYIPHAATWLNRKPWNDGPVKESNRNVLEFPEGDPRNYMKRAE